MVTLPWKRSLLIAGLVLLAGCGKEEAPASSGSAAPAEAAAPTPTPAPKSATPNSFDDVTAQLDPGGDFYLYLNSQQWLSNLNGAIDSLDEMALSEGGADNKADIDKGFTALKDLAAKSGLEDIEGIGASSFCYTPGLHRVKVFSYHAPDKGSGFIWSLFGKTPHPLTQLDFLPADTASAGFGDFDLAQFINILRQEATQSGIPEAQQTVTQIQTQFAGVAGLPLDDVLNSLSNSMGMVITLDASNTVDIPTGAGKVTIPTPRAALFIGVKDDTIFKQVDKTLSSNPGIIKVDQPDLKMRTMSFPAIPGMNLRPTVAQWNGYLVIASDDKLITDMIAVQKGAPGYKTNPDLVSLSTNMPTQGNGFSITTSRFAETFRKFQAEMTANQGNLNASQAQAIQNWLSKYQAMFTGYGVYTILPNGYLSVSQGKFTK